MGTETAAEQAEHMRHPRPAADRLRAIFEGDEHAHADGALIASLAKQVLAERDELRGRIGHARAEIVRQDVRGADTLRDGTHQALSDALAAVETHLLDPEYRTVATKGAE